MRCDSHEAILFTAVKDNGDLPMKTPKNINVLFVAGFGPIVRDPVASRKFYSDALQPLIFVERSQQQTKLFLKVIQVGNRVVGEVGRFKDEAFGDVTAAPMMIEHHQIALKKSVGW